MDDVVISKLNLETFKPLGITPEEVIANALRESGLLSSETTINELSPVELCASFLEKKTNYQQLTKLGNLLVKNRVITLQQLKEALAEQAANPSMKLGNILISMGACSRFDIERCIQSQDKIRDDMKKLNDYEDRVDFLRRKLSSGRVSNDQI